MSQYPDPNGPAQYPGNPQQPSPYAVPSYYSGGGVPVNRRPASVTAISIIGIIFGSLSFLCTGPGLILNLMMFGQGGRNPMAPQLPPTTQSVVVFSIFQSLANFLLAFFMLICCIAALKLKPFARKAMVPWSVVMIIWSITITIVTIAWLLPEIHKTTQAAQIYRMNPAMNSARHIGEIVGAVTTPMLMCIVPLGVLIWWTRPHVKAAFGEQGPAIQPGYPGNPPMQWPQ